MAEALNSTSRLIGVTLLEWLGGNALFSRSELTSPARSRNSLAPFPRPISTSHLNFHGVLLLTCNSYPTRTHRERQNLQQPCAIHHPSIRLPWLTKISNSRACKPHDYTGVALLQTRQNRPGKQKLDCTTDTATHFVAYAPASWVIPDSFACILFAQLFYSTRCAGHQQAHLPRGARVDEEEHADHRVKEGYQQRANHYRKAAGRGKPCRQQNVSLRPLAGRLARGNED